MSLLEAIVLLIGGSVIAVLLYGAYQFWSDEEDGATKHEATAKKPTRKPQAGTVPG